MWYFDVLPRNNVRTKFSKKSVNLKLEMKALNPTYIHTHTHTHTHRAMWYHKPIFSPLSSVYYESWYSLEILAGRSDYNF
jgi:hypothetical protein